MSQHTASYASFGNAAGKEFNAGEEQAIAIAKQLHARGLTIKAFYDSEEYKNAGFYQTAMRFEFKGLLGK